MSNAALAEFPFVAELPKREKSKVGKLWDQIAEMKAVVDEHGQLLPAAFVSNLLSVSRQRVDELAERGTLVAFRFNGHVFLTEKSVVAWCKSERKTGRPVKVPSTTKEIWAAARKSASGK